MNKKIEEIKIVSNVRKDLGDMTELTASVKEKGIIEPLVITNDGELIAGRRRLEAAKAAGLKEVPVHVVTTKKNEEDEIQLIENIQRKELDAIEEGEAFAAYMQRTGHGKEHLAKKIGKKVDYIERRISLAGLDDAAKKALKDKKIKLGHAVIMSKYPKKKHKGMIKSITTGRLGGYYMDVDDFADHLIDNDAVKLKKANFDAKTCEGCEHNGGHQAILTDTDGVMKDTCLNPVCFKKKQQEWLKARTKELQDKGVKILTEIEVEKIQGAEHIRGYHNDHAAAKRSVYSSKKPSEIYAVVFTDSRYHGEKGILENIWRIAAKPKKKQDTSKMSEDDLHNLEIAKKSKALHKLAEKISIFKHQLLKDIGSRKMISGLQLKQILVWNLYARFNYASHGITAEKEFAKISAMDEKQLDEYVNDHLAWIINSTSSSLLEMFAGFVGVDLKEDFEISEEFLDLYTKDQLISLAAELKIPLGKVQKASQLKEVIRQGWKKGQIPKILAKKLG